MRKEIVIKGRTLREGRPLLCVPIMGEDAEDIISQAASAAAQEIPMLEWRADYFAGLEDEDALRRVLRDLTALCEETVLLVTVRSSEQGGRASLAPEYLKRTLSAIASAGGVDMVDVEYFWWEDAAEIIRLLREDGVIVVASHHDFKKTPSIDEMWDILYGMQRGGADVVKLAVMPQNLSDTLCLMDTTYRFRCQYPDTPAISMAMGQAGMLSRIAGECFGSCVTFGCIGAASAPGQLPAEQLERLLREIHDSVGCREA